VLSESSEKGYTGEMLVVGTVAVDRSEFPVVLLNELGAQASVPHFLEAFERLLEGQTERFVSLHDVRNVHGWDLPERMVVHDWLNARVPVLSRLVLGHATIVTGIQQRTMAGAVLWGTKFEENVTCFYDLDEAKAWARTLLATGKRR
jgi:hypothetical protein